MRRLGWGIGLAVCSLLASCGNGDFEVNRKPRITAADLNLLHGLFCPAPSDHCRLPGRVELFFEFVRERGCPDVVTLQEIWPPAIAEMQPYLGTVCPFPYQLVQGQMQTQIDDEAVLSRYPVVAINQRGLFGGFRRVLQTRIDHPSGLLDVFSTHLASGSDGGPSPCGPDCPAECVAAGAATVRDCQAVQMVQFIEAQHDVPGPALVNGDFNDEPGSFVYEQFVGRGWIDTYLAAGNPECEPSTGIGCTSGRADEELAGLESPAIDEDERIDFIFLIPAAPGASCAAGILPPRAGGGAGTRLFADVPNPFVVDCGPLPEAICWPSDHIGVQVALGCR